MGPASLQTQPEASFQNMHLQMSHTWEDSASFKFGLRTKESNSLFLSQPASISPFLRSHPRGNNQHLPPLEKMVRALVSSWLVAIPRETTVKSHHVEKESLWAGHQRKQHWLQGKHTLIHFLSCKFIILLTVEQYMTIWRRLQSFLGLKFPPIPLSLQEITKYDLMQ